MPLPVFAECPSFTAPTQDGTELNIKEYLRNSWAVLFSYPADFTPVCSTEMAEFARYYDDFMSRNCRLIGISTDSSESHKRWLEDIQKLGNKKVTFPVVSDVEGKGLEELGFLEESIVRDADSTKRHRISIKPVRGLYIISPEMRIQFVQIMPPSVGRNVLEVLRVLDAVQLACLRNVATPAGWQKGQDVLLPLTNDDQSQNEKKEKDRKGEPEGVKVVFPYLKFVHLKQDQSLQSTA